MKKKERKKNILHDMALNHGLNKKQIIFLCLVQNEAEIENEKTKTITCDPPLTLLS